MPEIYSDAIFPTESCKELEGYPHIKEIRAVALCQNRSDPGIVVAHLLKIEEGDRFIYDFMPSDARLAELKKQGRFGTDADILDNICKILKASRPLSTPPTTTLLKMRGFSIDAAGVQQIAEDGL